MKNRVRKYRMLKGFSQEELSKLTGIPRTTISAIESRKVSPSVEYALRLASVLGCSVEELFRQEEIKLFRDFSEGPFLSTTIGNKTVVYPLSKGLSGYLPPDGVLKGGKLQWVRKDSKDRTFVFAGCDPSMGMLSHMLIEEGVRFVPFYSSSREALELLKAGYIHMAGVHLGRLENNIKVIKDILGGDYKVLRVFFWEEGIALRGDLQIKSIREIKYERLIWLVKEEGAGARKLFENIREELGPIEWKEFKGGHDELALSLKNGLGDAGVCIKFSALKAELGFLSVDTEDYCICYREELEEDRNFIKVIETIKSKNYRQRISSLPGYHLENYEEITI
ncbi:MAG: substrate-binding domain-containing protein [Aquificaceae bacterium]